MLKWFGQRKFLPDAAGFSVAPTIAGVMEIGRRYAALPDSGQKSVSDPGMSRTRSARYDCRSTLQNSQTYLRSGRLTGMWREELTTRGLPSGWLQFLIVSRSRMNFSASMGVASMNVSLYLGRSDRRKNSINNLRGFRPRQFARCNNASINDPRIHLPR